MLQDLDWEILESRRSKLQLVLMYKIVNNLVDIKADLSFDLNINISENNIHGSYNIVIYNNMIGLEQKQYSLFGSGPNLTSI